MLRDAGPELLGVAALGRPTAVVLALALWTGAAAAGRAHVLVLRTGARLEVLQPPAYDVTGHSLVVTPDGRRFVLHRSSVSATATAAANRPREDDEASKVWTTRDLERLRAEGRGRVTIAGSSDDAASPLPAARPRPPAPAEEERWREAARTLQGRVVALERRIAILERADQGWENYLLATGTLQGRVAAAAASDLGDIRRRRVEAEAALQQARGELNRLHDEARRASVPPGWLR